MESIFNQIYYGKIHPYERDRPPTPEQEAAAHEAKAALKALWECLTPEQRVLLEEVQSKQSVVDTLELREMFGKGVCFEARVIMEVWILTEDEPEMPEFIKSDDDWKKEGG